MNNTELPDRKYFIYKWYVETFKEKEEFEHHYRCSWKYVLDGFITGLTLFIFKKTKQKYCPRCCTKVDNISYYESPIFSFGCPNCRKKKTSIDIDNDGCIIPDRKI